MCLAYIAGVANRRVDFITQARLWVVCGGGSSHLAAHAAVGAAGRLQAQCEHDCGSFVAVGALTWRHTPR
jgi:hypothetical protein